ncbi:dihydrofolate reductase [Methylocapsa sp. S129]|uniref:dihydrofolate reductase n=1 Tax=Methylocapsa sp. S129 TaxID=1641869 RepID=UPI00131AF838|nr:dihydrofolate reductase [Methylocapsa sp. S129]
MSRAAIALVAAVARNGVIGADNRLIWKLSTDMKRFRALTWGKPFVTGRKNFESIGRLLPGRETIIVTRDGGFDLPGARVAHDIEAALSLAEEIAREMSVDEIIIAGGGEIYRQTIDRADRLFITEVDLAPQGDVHFPTIDPARWREVKRERGARGERDEAEFTYVDYVRREP